MNMFKKSFFVLIFISLTSCEDVIKLDLKNSEPRLVIESYIDINEQSATVLVSKSNGFYENKPVTKISNAVIQLKNNKGISHTFTEISSGKYTSNKKIITEAKEQWTIKITVDNTTYTATTTTPYPAVLSNLSTKKDRYSESGNYAQYHVLAHWNSKNQTKNYYRVRSVSKKTSYLGDYNYVLAKNTSTKNRKFKVAIPYLFSSGTIAKIQLMSVSEEYYNYFRQLANIQYSQTPYNPKGNFNNNALGYFGIFSTSEKEIQI